MKSGRRNVLARLRKHCGSVEALVQLFLFVGVSREHNGLFS